MKEFVNLDDKLTDQLLALQTKAVELGLLAQKFEDEMNASYTLSHSSGVRSINKIMTKLEKKSSFGPSV